MRECGTFSTERASAGIESLCQRFRTGRITFGYLEERMQQLIRRYLDRDLGRRGFIQRLAGVGCTLAAAKAFLEPLDPSARPAVHPAAAAATTIEGTASGLVVAQASA